MKIDFEDFKTWCKYRNNMGNFCRAKKEKCLENFCPAVSKKVLKTETKTETLESRISKLESIVDMLEVDFENQIAELENRIQDLENQDLIMDENYLYTYDGESIPINKPIKEKYKTVVKSKEELLKWFEENGYEKRFLWYCKDGSVTFYNVMFRYCNQEVPKEKVMLDGNCQISFWYFLSDWVKQVPVEESAKKCADGDDPFFDYENEKFLDEKEALQKLSKPNDKVCRILTEVGIKGKKAAENLKKNIEKSKANTSKLISKEKWQMIRDRIIKTCDDNFLNCQLCPMEKECSLWEYSPNSWKEGEEYTGEINENNNRR